jgi:hypothetical protein
MEAQIIEIPKKTFDLYTQGVRSFVHLPRDRHDELSKLKFSDKVVLVNKETGEKLEQTFWFLHSFWQIERFIFLVFAWERYKGLFPKRISCAIGQLDTYSGLDAQSIAISWQSSPDYQQRLYSSVQAYSAFMFISDSDGYVPPIFRFETKVDGGYEPRFSDRYVLVDTLLIKKNPNLNDSQYWKVHSVFPLVLL